MGRRLINGMSGIDTLKKIIEDNPGISFKELCRKSTMSPARVHLLCKQYTLDVVKFTRKRKISNS